MGAWGRDSRRGKVRNIGKGEKGEMEIYSIFRGSEKRARVKLFGPEIV